MDSVTAPQRYGTTTLSLECRTEISPNKNEKSGIYLIIKAHEKMYFGLKDTLYYIYLFEFIYFVYVLEITE
ncbi:hypothetical protein AN2353V1_1769 [Citrobacter koseri]|nr:hypothetical protein AN2353V1_1769 [Citrobacter koseri]CAH6038501.1 hypothetical protein AN2353V1_1769 [Citrobacter koseri]